MADLQVGSGKSRTILKAGHHNPVSYALKNVGAPTFKVILEGFVLECGGSASAFEAYAFTPNNHLLDQLCIAKAVAELPHSQGSRLGRRPLQNRAIHLAAKFGEVGDGGELAEDFREEG